MTGFDSVTKFSSTKIQAIPAIGIKITLTIEQTRINLSSFDLYAMNPYKIANKIKMMHTMILNKSLVETPKRQAEVIAVKNPSKRARIIAALRIGGQSKAIIIQK